MVCFGMGMAAGCAPYVGEDVLTGDDKSSSMTLATAARRTCCTNVANGLSTQILQELGCMLEERGSSVRFASLDMPGVDLGSSCPTYPYVQASVADSVRAALAGARGALTIHSSTRTIAQQYLVHRWRQLGGRCGIRRAAPPGGSSTHQSGLAIDIDRDQVSSFGWRLGRQGFSPIRRDPGHYEKSGTPLNDEAVKAFQRLWNRAHDGVDDSGAPNGETRDVIAVDGDYGPATAARLARSPVDGFSTVDACGSGLGHGSGGGGSDSLHRDDPAPQTVCETATCWQNHSVSAPRCASLEVAGDFASGRYDMHVLGLRLRADSVITVALSRTDEGAAEWEPALVVTDAVGEVLFDGMSVTAAATDAVERGTLMEPADPTTLQVHARAAETLWLHITSLESLTTEYDSGVPTSSAYALDVTHTAPVGDEDACNGWSSVHAGVDRDGVPIPRQGVWNPTLGEAEPLGTLVDVTGHAFVSGRPRSYGGPGTRSGTTALTREDPAELNTPLNPDGATLAANPERYYYVSMRFDYEPQGREWWINRKLLVVNPSTGSAVVVRAVDWGPLTRDGQIMNLSPQALTDLGDHDELHVAFATDDAPLGQVTH